MKKTDTSIDQHKGISRRTFMKGAAAGAAGLAVASTVLGSTAMAASAATITVEKSACTVTVNGAAKNFEAYLINSNNYLKLRDIAATLNGTNKQFSVSYDAASKAVSMVSGQAYAAVGGEMTALAASATAQLTPCSIKLDGKVVDATAYLINGNNFFKLRDIMEALDVYVGYDQTSKNVTLDTSKPYAAETPVVVVPSSGTTSASKKVSTRGSSKDGIYVKGENIVNKDYTLPFTELVQLTAIFEGEAKEGVIWRSSDKFIVTINNQGQAKMAEGVGYLSAEISAEWDGIIYTTTLNTTPKADHSMEIDEALTRGEFMTTIANYFGWYHYNNYVDDGVDIDADGNELKEVDAQGNERQVNRPRNYYDVNGDAEFVKAIECALDEGVLTAKSSKDKFYPYDEMTRVDAAQIIYTAWKLKPLGFDCLAGFADADEIPKSCYEALNALVGMGLFHGRTNLTIEPRAGITEPELRVIMQQLAGRQVAPCWTMAKNLRRLARNRVHFHCPTENVEIYYRWRTFNPMLDGKPHNDGGTWDKPNGSGITTQPTYGEWMAFQMNGDTPTGTKQKALADDASTWTKYIPGWSEDKEFGCHNQSYEPDKTISCMYEFQYFARDINGILADGPVCSTTLKFYRRPWHKPVTDTLHAKAPGYPLVVRFFDNFQACAYYIEGSERGVLYDGLMISSGPTYGEAANLYKIVKDNYATKPFCFVLGHNHGDHSGALKDFYKTSDGVDYYLADRVGPYHDFPGDHCHRVVEGDTLDLGDVTLEVTQLPGHCDDMLLLYDRKNGLLFSSDIYGVNRYWVGDNFSAVGVKQDFVLSLHQQLMDNYTADGAKVKELYTGHNRCGVSGDYMMIWEKSLQNMINFGPDGMFHNHRSSGGLAAMNATNNDRHMNLNWQCFSQSSGKAYLEYLQSEHRENYRIRSIINDENTVNGNLFYDWRTNAHLSNVTFQDAKLVGADFYYHKGFADADVTIGQYFETATTGGWFGISEAAKALGMAENDPRPRYVIPDKFVPWKTYESSNELDEMGYTYQVKVSAIQTKVTFTPTAMSERCASIKVNGKIAASRCPITVSTSSPCTITLVGPNGDEQVTYRFQFVTA